MLLALICSAAIAHQDVPQSTVAPMKRWFVFLTKGTNKSPLTEEQSAAGMKAHLGNFGAQYKAGRLDLAGPLTDNGFIRGIVAVRAYDERGVRSLFKDDVFVQENRLALEMYAMDGPFDKITHPEDEVGMTNLTLVIFKKGLKWSPVRRAPSSTKQWDKDGKLAFWARFGLKDSDKLGMAYFWEPDVRRVTEWVALDPLVQSGELAFEAHPQFIGKMFRNQPSSP